MQINWFTVIAEIINFLVLVWLLKRFLYKPVLEAIEIRENKIRAELKDAATSKAEAEKQQEEFRKKNEAFELGKKALMDQAIRDTNATRDKMLEAVINEANSTKNKLEKSLKDRERDEDRRNTNKTREKALAITRKTLADLASTNLEEQIVALFIRRLKNSDEPEKKRFREAFNNPENKILVQSAFELPLYQQTEINETVNELLGKKTPLEYKINPGLVSGMELSTEGYKLGWSIPEYLSSLERDLSTASMEKTEEPHN